VKPIEDEQNVTVCIAAPCKDGDERRIVLCVDWKVSSPLGSSDKMLKLRKLTDKWYCLTSGIDNEINILVAMMRKAFVRTGAIDETNISPLIRSTLNSRKKDKIDEFIRGRYGIAYDDFLYFGKEKFSADVHREAILTLSGNNSRLYAYNCRIRWTLPNSC
jgi:hypothetical protein